MRPVRKSANDVPESLFALFSTGRRIGLSPPKRVVAGSSPAFGTTRRSSSGVEHVFPVRLLSVVISYESIPKGRDVLERICRLSKLSRKVSNNEAAANTRITLAHFPVA